jgi:hypothetical protein
MTIQPMLPQADGAPGHAKTVGGGGFATVTAATDPKLAKLTSAAQSFEAKESEGGASDTIKGMATDALGKALAASGGVGIARKIVKEVTAEQEATKVRRGETKVQ